MVDYFTRTIRSGPAEAVRAAPAGEAAVTNRAAWPTGPLPAFGVVSERNGMPARQLSAGEAGPETTPDPA